MLITGPQKPHLPSNSKARTKVTNAKRLALAAANGPPFSLLGTWTQSPGDCIPLLSNWGNLEGLLGWNISFITRRVPIIVVSIFLSISLMFWGLNIVLLTLMFLWVLILPKDPNMSRSCCPDSKCFLVGTSFQLTRLRFQSPSKKKSINWRSSVAKFRYLPQKKTEIHHLQFFS